MLKFKKTEVLLVILIILSVSGFYIIQNPPIITKLFLIDTKVTQQPLSLSVAITGSTEEYINTSATGTVTPTDTMVLQTISKITGLTDHVGDNIKIRVYTNDSTPTGFTAPATTLITTVFKYINITLNDTLSGTATIFFNVSQSDLGSIDTDDIRLYKYTTSWNELTTTVIDGTADPAEFSATTTSFSNFLIGEAAEEGAVVTPPLSGPTSKGGLKLGLEKPVPRPKPVKLIIPTAKKIIEKIIKLPAHLIRYKISYNIIYITAISLILIIFLLEFIYHYISKKK